jgi:hypothetical protein
MISLGADLEISYLTNFSECSQNIHGGDCVSSSRDQYLCYVCRVGGSNSQPFNPHTSWSLSASAVGIKYYSRRTSHTVPSNQYLLTSIEEFSKLYKIVNIIHSTLLIIQLYSVCCELQVTDT